MFLLLQGKIDMKTAPWPQISSAAKDCVLKLLNRDPANRPTAAEILQVIFVTTNTHQEQRQQWPEEEVVTIAHTTVPQVDLPKVAMKRVPLAYVVSCLLRRSLWSWSLVRLTVTSLQHDWLKSQGVALDTPIDNVVISRMKRFAAMNKLKKAAMLEVARCMKPEQIQGLKELFQTIDADNSGTITVDELRKALADMGNSVTVRRQTSAGRNHPFGFNPNHALLG